MRPDIPHNEPGFLRLLAKGDQHAFRTLFDAYMQPLCYFGFQLIQDKEEAKDIAIGVFSNLFESHERIGNITNIRSYLFTSMRNSCLNYLRHLKVVKRAAGQLLSDEIENARADALLIHSEVLQRIYEEIESLSPRLREILILSVVHGLSNRDIAGKMGISESHVRADRSRAVAYLRAAFAKKGMLEAFILLTALAEAPILYSRC